MSGSNGQPKIDKCVSAWKPGLEKLLRRMEQAHFHGEIRIVVYDGTVTRLLIETSIADPKALLEGHPERIADLADLADAT